MSKARPIETAPHDGRKVRLLWTDADGQENETPGQYRDPSRLKAAGGDWDEGDGGWWVFVDGSTQKKVTPHGWIADSSDDDDPA